MRGSERRRTDATDAGIALTVEVMLPVNPSFPIGQSNVVTDSCGSGPCAGQPVPMAPPPSLFLESAPVDPVVARLRVDSGKKILPGDTFDVVLELDTGGHELGSFSAVLSWNTDDAVIAGASDGSGSPLGRPTINDTGAGQGKIRFAAASPLGATGTFELLRMTMTAGHALPRPERIFDVKFRSMAATGPGFESLLPVLEIEAPAKSNGRP